jgi:hypothetical protein
MATSQSNVPAQIRDLRMDPDPQEPSFSDEEKINNQSPLLLDEDEFHRLTVRTSQRLRGSGVAHVSTPHNHNHHHRYSNSSSNQDLNSSEMIPNLRSSVVKFGNDVGVISSNTQTSDGVRLIFRK